MSFDAVGNTDDAITLLDEPHPGWNMARDKDGKLFMVWIEEALTPQPPVWNS
jgi:hypothetical protein